MLQQTRRAVLLALAGACLLFAILQLWRPYFFLNDDNLCGVLPAMADIGNTLVHGQFPWKYHFLYAGNSALFTDPGAISIFHPFFLAAALLTQTPLKYCAIDFICFLNLLIGAGFFAALAVTLSERHKLSITPEVAALLALSYVATTYSIAIGACWYNFLANQATAPIIALGMFCASRKWGYAWCALGFLQGLFGGHLSPFCFSLVFFGLWAIATGLVEKKTVVPARFFGGGLIALILALPVLLIALHFVWGSNRAAAGLPEAEIRWFNVPFFSQVVGGITQMGLLLSQRWMHWPSHVGDLFGFSTIGLIFVIVLCHCRKWRPDQWTVLGVMLVVMLFVDRPEWLQAILLRLPVFKSLRWPVREMVFVLFFAHVLVLLGWSQMGRKIRWISFAAGACLYIVTMAQLGPPAFNPFLIDRYLLLSGNADATWRTLRQRLDIGPDTMIVPTVPFAVAVDLNAPMAARAPLRNAMIHGMPHCLACGYNFPALFGMKTATGYDIRGFVESFHKLRAVAQSGYFNEQGLASLKGDPEDLLFVRILQVFPPRIQYTHGAHVATVDFSQGLTAAPVVTSQDGAN